MNGPDTVAANLIVAVILVPIVWYLIRDLRTSINVVGRGLSDLTLAIALDVATREHANPDTRRIARRIARDHGGDLRARDLTTAEEEEDDRTR